MHLSIVYDGKIVGGASFHAIDRIDQSAEIGYWLAKSATGKGLITKTVAAMVEYGFNEMNLNRIVIKCATGNLKSQAVPERLGFTREGVEREAGFLHGKFVDHVVYSMLAKEWKRQ